MKDLDHNSEWLIAWWNRIAPIVNGTWGLRLDLCQDLARRMGELGNDSPSDAAIEEAKRWELEILAGRMPWMRDEGD